LQANALFLPNSGFFGNGPGDGRAGRKRGLLAVVADG